MKINIKFILLICAAIILFVGMNYCLKEYVVLPSFQRLEVAEAEKSINRVLDSITSEARHLQNLCADWAIWDDTYYFVADGNEEYIDSNLGWEGLEESTNIMLLYVVDTEGKVTYGEAYDFSSENVIEVNGFPRDKFNKSHFLLQHPSAESRITGVIVTDIGPILVSSVPITDSNGTSPMGGTLIMGRLLDEDMLQKLEEQTHIDFKSKVIKDAKLFSREIEVLSQLKLEPFVVEEKDEDVLLVYGVVNNINEEPSILITVNEQRNILREGKKAANLILLVVTAAISAFIVMFLVYLGIIKKYTKQIEEIVEKRTKELSEVNRKLEENEATLREKNEKLSANDQQLRAMNEVLEGKVKQRTEELEKEKNSLEEKVKERTEEIESNLSKLEAANDAMKGRELRIIELKNQVNELLKELGKSEEFGS